MSRNCASPRLSLYIVNLEPKRSPSLSSAQTPKCVHASDWEEASHSSQRDHGGRLKYAVLVLLSFGLALTGPSLHAGAHGTATDPSRLAWELARSNPTELMRRISRNEIANSYGHRPPMRYRLQKITKKTDTTKEIVETADGGVARLVAIDGKPLSPSQEQKEIDRLHTLDADPAIQAHRRHNEIRDAERVRKFTRMLPDAFLYRSAGEVETANGAMIRLSFTPNPKFSPPDFESRILTGIRGEVWIDAEELRVVRMEGHIFKVVDFGWGILGSLYPGGTLLLEQSKTDACGWQLTHLSLHMNGKALLFKSIDIATEETATDYQTVPRDWKYRDAIRWLLQMPLKSEEQTKKP